MPSCAEILWMCLPQGPYLEGYGCGSATGYCTVEDLVAEMSNEIVLPLGYPAEKVARLISRMSPWPRKLRGP